MTNNGDTLKGAVFMPSYGGLFRAHMEGDYRLYYEDIRHIRLYRNWGPPGYFDLLVRPGGLHGKIWQLEAGTDTAGVMDNMRIAPLLLDFIRQYYPTDRVFADEREMIEYLAGKAGELLPRLRHS